MFGKKKREMFGGAIEPDCGYCAHNQAHGCELGSGEQPCGHFRYDPLRRVPAQTPPMKKYDPDEFKL